MGESFSTSVNRLLYLSKSHLKKHLDAKVIDKQNVAVIKFYIIIIKEEIIKNVKTLQKYRDKRIHPKDQNKR